MAIQLRNQTQQTEKPSALAYGVGLPVSDGGAGAIAQALGQVAGAAGQFAKRKEALNNQAITDATNTYQNEVNTQVSAASAAAKAEDMEAYEAAMAEMDKLQGAPLNAFAAATDKPLKIKEEDWQSKQLAADAWYTAKRGALDVSTVNSQYTAKFSRSLKEVGSAAQLNISEGNLGTSGMMELIDRSELLHNGDLSVGATAPAMDKMEASLASLAVNQLAAFESSKSKYTSVTAWNKDVDIMKDMVAQSDSYGRYNGRLMKSIEKLRVAEPKGVNVPLTGAAESLLNNSVETLKTASHFDPNLSAKLVDTINQYEGKQVSPAVGKQLTSVKKLNALVTEFGSEDNRVGLVEYLKFNPDITAEEFLNEVNTEGTMFDNMRPTERNAYVAHVAHVMDSIKSVPTEHSSNKVFAGERQLNTTAALAAQSPENALRFKQGKNSQNQALNAYNLENPEASMGFIREANEHFSPVTSVDYSNSEFVGLNTTVDFLRAALKANPNNGKAYVAALGVTKNMLGEKRVANFIASHIESDATPELNMIAAGLQNNAIQDQEMDVKAQSYVLQGMNRGEWFAGLEKESPARAKYTTWKEHKNGDNSLISKVINSFGVMSEADGNYWTNYAEGFAIQKLSDDPNISLESLDQLVTTHINDRVEIHENAYGNTSVVMMAKREDGSFAGDFMSFVKRTSAIALRGSVLAIESSPLIRLNSMFGGDFAQDKLTSMSDIAEKLPQDTLRGEEYVTGRLHRAVLHAIDSDILQYNIKKMGDPSVEAMLNELGSPAEVIIKLMQTGDVRLSNTMDHNGVPMYTLEVRQKTRRAPSGVSETLLTGGKVTDEGFVPLVGKDNESFKFSAKSLDIKYNQYKEDVNRIKEMTQYQPLGAGRPVPSPYKDPAAIKARGDRIDRIFDYTKSLF